MLKLKAGIFLGNNRRSYDADGLIVSETEYQRRVFEGWHAHENHHLTLILRGGNREQRKNIELEAAPGSLLFYRGGEFHRNSGTLHPSKNINLEIKSEFLERYQARVSLNNALPDDPKTKFTLLKIYRECLTADAQTFAAAHSLALAMLDSPFEEKSNFPSWAHRLREILNDRWNEVLSLEELSQFLGIHPVTISKKFPTLFFCTLGEYARKLKVEKAIFKISQTNFSQAEIAHQCGFADQSHFIRIFKSFTGFTPKDFKNILKG